MSPSASFDEVSTTRLAGYPDAVRVAEVTVRAYVNEGFLAADDAYVEELRDVEARIAGAEVWVAETDGRLVGAVTFCPPGSAFRELAQDLEGEFRMLAVDPAARGRGAARALVARCFERCRDLGLAELVLCSMPTMRPAHSLYEKMGFRRDDSLDWDVDSELTLWGFRAAVPPNQEDIPAR